MTIKKQCRWMSGACMYGKSCVLKSITGVARIVSKEVLRCEQDLGMARSEADHAMVNLDTTCSDC